MATASGTASIEPTFGEQTSAAVNRVFRKGILLATHNRLVASGVRRYGMRLGAARFVAGETLDEAVPVLRGLNQQGLKTNTTLLGEGVRSASEAAVITDTYCAVLDRIAQEQLTTNIALKLTHLGLDLGEDVAFENVSRIVAHAAESGNFIRLDMEESSRVDPTLRIYRRLREQGRANVGIVLQAMLYRTPDDLKTLLPLEPNLRLVKGAYLEPASVAYPKKPDVDRAYVEIIETALLGDGYTAIATHDERIIEHVIEFTKRQHISPERFEFQMLYGIRPQLQRQLATRGYQVLVATPYGTEWYFYLMRRLAERPANVLFFFRNLMR